MYHLLPIRRLFGIFALVHIILLLLVTFIFKPNASPFELLRYSSLVIFILDVLVLVTSTLLWRRLWKRVPLLSDHYFPDLNGIWQGNIAFESNLEPRSLEAKVRIRQNLWSIHIDLCSETSKSSTLVAYPTTESGNKILYYIYNNVSKTPSFGDYKGTSVLSVDTKSSSSRLNGHYFTARGTKGRIELERVSSDPNQPYELY